MLGRTEISVPHPGLSLRVPLSRATLGPLVGWHVTWKTRIIASLLRGQEGGFVDAGANVGQTLLDYRHAAADCGYWGFEPNPDCVKIVARIIELNELTKCSLFDVGLSDGDSNGILYREPGFATDTRATIDAYVRPSRRYDEIPVRLAGFDRLREAHGIGSPSLIKIDVEGSESSALRGMAGTLARDRPPVLCEVLLRDRDADPVRHRRVREEIIRLLRDVGFPRRRGARPAVGRSGHLEQQRIDH